MIVGLVSSLVLVFISPNVWAPDGSAILVGKALFPLTNPGIISIPLGFLAAIVGTLVSSEKVDAKKYDEILVTAHTGFKENGELSILKH